MYSELGYELDDKAFESLEQRDSFLFSKLSTTALRLTKFPNRWVQRFFHL